MDIRLSAIHLYPVKGIRAVDTLEAHLEANGLRGDRRWVIVDDEGKFLSQRTHPRMALIGGAFDGHRLFLTAPGQDPLNLEMPAGKRRIKVTVWRDHLDAAAVDPATDQWLSRFLDHPCRLAFMDDTCRRPISSAGGLPGETVSFADGYPCLAISTASLADLNSRLDEPLPMDRFRPNLVVDGCDPFAEDGWRKIAVGETVLRYAGLCARCSVITVDQASGLRRCEEPLRTLATYRQRGNGVVFGINLVPEKMGVITVGDPVKILE
jgi:uncharacterized protein YcbX